MEFLSEEYCLLSRGLLQKMATDIRVNLEHKILADLDDNSFIAIHYREKIKGFNLDLITDPYFVHGKRIKKESHLYQIFKAKNLDWREKIQLFELYFIKEAINQSKSYERTNNGINKSYASKILRMSREAMRRKLNKSKMILKKLEGDIDEKIQEL